MSRPTPTSDDENDQWLRELMGKTEGSASTGEAVKRHLGLLQYTLSLFMFAYWHPINIDIPSILKFGKGTKTSSPDWSDANFQEKLNILDRGGSIEMRVMKAARHRVLVLPTMPKLWYILCSYCTYYLAMTVLTTCQELPDSALLLLDNYTKSTSV